MQRLVFLVLLAAGPITTPANNVTVTNVCLQWGGNDSQYINVDVSWNNSWRASWTDSSTSPSVTVTNWDAAWIFVKYRLQGGNWHHATLSATNADHKAPQGATIVSGLCTNIGGTNFAAGVFLYRSSEGAGPWTNKGVKLRWNNTLDGVTVTTRVDISVHAIEMVYVPTCSFSVGSGGSEEGSFTDGAWAAGTSFPFRITSEAAIEIGNTAGKLWSTLGNHGNGGYSGVGDDGTLPAGYPKGYSAFYCMKYEVTQGQYADFLNMLEPAQATARYQNKYGSDRYGIANNSGIYSADAPDRALVWSGSADLMAYADWTGLRPMTELEREKANRGPAAPVPDEYAWGNTTFNNITAFSGIDGSGTETPGSDANNVCGGTIGGPVRAGIFATNGATRTTSGASYWGIMELSGNAWEIAVSVGHSTSRPFTGIHGNGEISASGTANVDGWNDSMFGEFQGGWRQGAGSAQTVSYRYWAVSSGPISWNRDDGFRCCRTAP